MLFLVVVVVVVVVVVELLLLSSCCWVVVVVELLLLSCCCCSRSWVVVVYILVLQLISFFCFVALTRVSVNKQTKNQSIFKINIQLSFLFLFCCYCALMFNCFFNLVPIFFSGLLKICQMKSLSASTVLRSHCLFGLERALLDGPSRRNGQKRVWYRSMAG